MSKKQRSKRSDSPDKTPKVFQNEKIDKFLEIKQRNDLTEKQKQFLKLALDNHNQIIFVSGPAGTSKTFVSVLAVLELLNLKKVSDLIYVRSVVESSDNKIGYLPGDANEKLTPYVEPLLEKLEELLNKPDIDYLLKQKRVHGKPTGYLRGLNWNAKGIILDEAQNSSLKEGITLMTRMGKFSKLFICGDPMQSDINGKSGFNTLCEIFDNDEAKKNGIQVFYFDENDIVRSEIVKYITKVISNYKSKIHPLKKK